MPTQHQHLIEKLKSLDSWEQIYTDADLIKRVFTSHNNLKSIYEDLRQVKERESCLYDRFFSYLSAAGQALLASSNNTLLRVLDGQQCRLDSKYGLKLTKKNNVPVIMITNSPVRSLREQGPFNERIMRLRFKSRIPHLRADRLISTLWGCIHRRLLQKDVDWRNSKSISLQYNELKGELPNTGKVVE